MATALAATPQPATVSAPASVLLNVTGAPSPPTTAYTSNFAATVDGWAVGYGFTPTIVNDTSRTPAALRLRGTAGASGAVSTIRAVTGLTVGAAYRLRLSALTMTGQAQLSVREAGGTVVATGTWVAVPARAVIDLAFTPTQTAMTLEVFAKRLPTDAPTARADLEIDTISVAPTGSWAGAAITRTDANGVQPVRNPNKLDTTGGVLTLTDYDAALVGTCSYTVVDGAGGTASASCTLAVAGQAPSLTLPATALLTSASSPPRFAALSGATNYDEASESQGTVHVVLGRADKLSNPGPLSTRTGTLELWCANYAAAVAVRALLAADPATVALFRQGDYPGLDLYLVARTIAIVPAEPTPTRRWLTTVTYDEVPPP